MGVPTLVRGAQPALRAVKPGGERGAPASHAAWLLAASELSSFRRTYAELIAVLAPRCDALGTSVLCSRVVLTVVAAAPAPGNEDARGRAPASRRLRVASS